MDSETFNLIKSWDKLDSKNTKDSLCLVLVPLFNSFFCKKGNLRKKGMREIARAYKTYKRIEDRTTKFKEEFLGVSTDTRYKLRIEKILTINEINEIIDTADQYKKECRKQWRYEYFCQQAYNRVLKTLPQSKSS